MARTSMPRQLRDGKKLQNALKSKSEAYWTKRGEKMALELFHDMAKRVPAYKDFLHSRGVNPKAVRTIGDFSQLPTIDKDNYLRQYPREDLCWDGRFADEPWVISTTSGSTGEPFYFPRTDLQDDAYATTAELYLRENFQIQDKTTLYIDAFAMGAWIGGVFTYEAVRRVASKGYALSIITPGINIPEVIRSVCNLGRNFDQVIIGCYPPILKDIIDMGIQQGVKWKDYNLGVVFSAEGFSEEFRDYIVRFGKLGNPYTSTLNHYGTVDLGTMSHETPASILVRRQAIKSKRLFKAIFGDVHKLPTFTQYMPEMFYFETVDNRVVCTSRGGLPLVRYDLKDNGGIISLGSVAGSYQDQGKDLQYELKTAGIDHTLWNLPFVYIYERSDFSVSWSGATIYVEEIKKALFTRHLQTRITGKFTMEIVTDAHLDNRLMVHAELKSTTKPSGELKQNIRESVIKVLLRENSEYRVLYGENKHKLQPEITLWPNGHPLYFSGAGKQRWMQKQK